MGLDGISVNQIRTLENNSAELNNSSRFNAVNDRKVVDGLAEGQKVDPDRENEHDNPQLASGSDIGGEEQDEILQEETKEEVFKYDLSDSNKYLLQLDEKTNNILIIEKASTKVVQQIDADQLVNYVGFLSNSQGSLINRKF